MRHENMEFRLIQMCSLIPRQDLSASSSRVATGNALAVAVHHKEVPNATR